MRVARRLVVAAAMGLALVAGGAACADATVILRGKEQPVVATSVLAGLRGLEARGGAVRSESGSRTIPWDLVRSIEGGNAGPGTDEYLAIGLDLWRARIRVERADARLARPLFLKHADRYVRGDGPTSALVAEGLLRCALAEGDLRGAVVPWLASLRIQSTGEPSRFVGPGLPAVLDDATGLLPALGPFVPARIRPDLLDELRGMNAGGAERGLAADVAVRFARLVEASDRAATTASAAGPSAAAANGAPPALRALAAVEAIVLATDERALAKATLDFDREFPDPPAFLAAWRLAAIGARAARLAQAVAGEDRARALEDAAIELLAVPASGLDPSGLVETYALEEASALLRESGDAPSADRIDALLGERARNSEAPGSTGRRPTGPGAMRGVSGGRQDGSFERTKAAPT